jgi:hypothetical protein
MGDSNMCCRSCASVHMLHAYTHCLELNANANVIVTKVRARVCGLRSLLLEG